MQIDEPNACAAIEKLDMFDDTPNTPSQRVEIESQPNCMLMQMQYGMRDYAKCQASRFIITGYRTKLVGYTIPTNIAIIEI